MAVDWMKLLVNVLHPPQLLVSSIHLNKNLKQTSENTDWCMPVIWKDKDSVLKLLPPQQDSEILGETAADSTH